MTSDVTLAIFSFGLPLAGFENVDDRYDDQIELIEGFVRRTRGLMDGADGVEGMTVRYISPVLTEDIFWEIVIKDVSLVIVSIVLVGVYMGIHMQSIFLASTGEPARVCPPWGSRSPLTSEAGCTPGMAHILISFPVAYLFAQASMDFGNLGILTLMAIFVILGIGASGDVAGMVGMGTAGGPFLLRGWQVLMTSSFLLTPGSRAPTKCPGHVSGDGGLMGGLTGRLTDACVPAQEDIAWQPRSRSSAKA